MARPAGLEPATYGLEGRCSIRLSYERLDVTPAQAQPRTDPLKDPDAGRGRGI